MDQKWCKTNRYSKRLNRKSLKNNLNKKEEKMKEILETIILNLVDDKNAVEINEVEEERKTITFEVKVAESDMGKIIGKQGRLAKSIRTVMKSIARKEHKKVSIEFLDNWR